MAWTFPDDAPFDMVVGSDSFFGCKLVALDDEHLTFDYEQKGQQGRYYAQRGQVKLEDVKAIYTDAIVARLRDHAPQPAEATCPPR